MYHWEVRFLPSASLRFRRNDGGRGPAFYNLRPLKGKRLTTFCASLALLHPLLSLTHWIFGSLMLPYKSSSLVQNVFAVHRFAQGAADWRSGPRWSILSVLCPVHPFATTWHFPSRGNKKFEEKNRESYTSCTTPAFPPLVAVATTLPGGKHVI